MLLKAFDFGENANAPLCPDWLAIEKRQRISKSRQYCRSLCKKELVDMTEPGVNKIPNVA